jgi:hypothetical protein
MSDNKILFEINENPIDHEMMANYYDMSVNGDEQLSKRKGENFPNKMRLLWLQLRLDALEMLYNDGALDQYKIWCSEAHEEVLPISLYYAAGTTQIKLKNGKFCFDASELAKSAGLVAD